MSDTGEKLARQLFVEALAGDGARDRLVELAWAHLTEEERRDLATLFLGVARERAEKFVTEQMVFYDPTMKMRRVIGEHLTGLVRAAVAEVITAERVRAIVQERIAEMEVAVTSAIPDVVRAAVAERWQRWVDNDNGAERLADAVSKAIRGK
jgi:hypothetical protein